MGICNTMNLPSYKEDNYVLDNGEEIHQEHPESYWIPEKNLRESLSSGDLVKLVFRMEETKGSEDLSVERMWVEIKQKHDEIYEGILDNDPAGSECVVCGQTVYFKACHVIQIYEE